MIIKTLIVLTVTMTPIIPNITPTTTPSNYNEIKSRCWCQVLKTTKNRLEDEQKEFIKDNLNDESAAKIKALKTKINNLKNEEKEIGCVN
jgi:5,10-methylenetetrahydrofolate reductase